MQRAWVALAVLSFLAAGCIGGGGSKSVGQATMGDLLPVAAAAAKQWDAGAQLLFVAGWEIPNETVERVHERDLAVPRDPSVGDGRSILWLYSYADGGLTRFLFIAVAANDTVVFRFEMANPGNADPATAEDVTFATELWKFDSDEALAKARTNESFAAVEATLTRPAFMHGLFGGPEPGVNHSVSWAVMAMDLPDYDRFSDLEDDGDIDFADVQTYLETATIAVAAVDAVTGEVHMAGDLGDFMTEPTEETTPPVDPHAGHQMGPRTLHEMEASGQVTLLEDSVTFPLPVAEDGATIEGNFTYGQGTVPGGATMHVTAANGTEIYSSGGTGLTTKETRVGVFVEDVPAGDYTVAVEIGNFAALAEWTFDLRAIATGMPPMGNDTMDQDEPREDEEPATFYAFRMLLAPLGYPADR